MLSSKLPFAINSIQRRFSSTKFTKEFSKIIDDYEKKKWFSTLNKYLFKGIYRTRRRFVTFGLGTAFMLYSLPGGTFYPQRWLKLSIFYCKSFYMNTKRDIDKQATKDIILISYMNQYTDNLLHL